MDIEFHYWITGILAVRAGLAENESQLVAFSSQFVDDNDWEVEVFDQPDDRYPSYVSHVSQTLDILRPKKELMKIYPVFHFIPGDQDRALPRKDGKTHPLNTTPNSSYAKKVMDYALQGAASRFKSGNQSGLMRLGIAIHGYADTWAHQNFAGCDSEFNAIGKNLIPDVGHADALHHPDWVGHRWTDSRLVGTEIDNNLRYLGAARAVHGCFTRFLEMIDREPQGKWEDVQGELNSVLGATYSGSENLGRDKRVKAYRKAGPFLSEYDAYKWLDQATEFTRAIDLNDQPVEQYVWKNCKSREDCNWYKFQEAVKEHILATTSILQPAYEAAGVSI